MTAPYPPHQQDRPPSAPAGGEEETYGVTTLELFFDLVFVFAVTQLTSILVNRMSPVGLLQVVLAFGVMWWMYGGYAWLTNAVSPRQRSHKVLLLIGMAGFLMLALATPHAFGSGGVIWGIGYLVVVLVHGALYMRVNRNVLRVVPANVLAALLVIAAGLLDHGPAVYVLWTLAMLIPIATPYVVRPDQRFPLRAPHIVERYGLAVIITFGESIIAIGIGLEGIELTGDLVVAAILGLGLVAALWWTYFVGEDERVEEELTDADNANRTRMILYGYFYAHIPLVVGVIAMAAGLKKTVGHPYDPLHFGPAFALAGGLALYLAGNVIFRRVMNLGLSRARLLAAAAALATIPLGEWKGVAQLATLAVVMLALLAVELRLAKAPGPVGVSEPSEEPKVSAAGQAPHAAEEAPDRTSS